MKIVCITHADFEGPGCIQSWAQNRGYDFSILKPYQGELLSSVSDYDMFIVMGGPQSPRDQDHLPYLSQEGLNDSLFAGMPSTFAAIHWHNDMPGLTEASKILAASQGCPRQIVRYAKRLYGFQCHLEITLEGIMQLIQAVPEDLKPSRFTQTEQELLSNDYLSINNTIMQWLDRFVAMAFTLDGKPEQAMV